MKKIAPALIVLTAFAALASCAHFLQLEKKRSLPNVPALKSDFKEQINGYKVVDPFRPMEEMKAASEWIEAQNARTQKYLKELPDDVTPDVTKYMGIGYITNPKMAGAAVFYTKRDGEMEKAVLAALIDGKETIILDPTKIDASGKTEIDWFYPSPDGKLVAYGLSKAGDENSSLSVIETATLKTLPDSISNMTLASVAWLKDSTGFYYTRFPENDRYNRKIYFHKLGDETAKDVLVFGEGLEKTDWPDLDLSADGKYGLITVAKGWSSVYINLLDRESGKITPVVAENGSLNYNPKIIGDKIYFITMKGAPRGRIMSLEIGKTGESAWKNVVSQTDLTLQAFEVSKDRLLVLALEKALSKLLVYSLDGKKLGEVALPMPGSIEAVSACPDSNKVALGYTSYLYPQSVLAFDAEKEPFKAEPLATVSGMSMIDPSAFEVRQVMYPSYDGTMVPMFIVHKKDLVLTGSNPTLLDGYGGFSVSMTPYFSRSAMFWTSRGGVYAVANIRGGGELGEDWHNAGMKEKKFQVFFDFEYAMRYLLSEGYASVNSLGIRGGSNGGLLMGAMITRVPHLFKCALAGVGLYDMVRYHMFPPGEQWVSEYGSSKDAKQTGYLWAYSPYHQVVKGVKYPALFADTADQDARVHWMHTVKFVAALQEATAGDAPILFWLDKAAGHGFGKTKTQIAEEMADKFKFLVSEIGDPAPKPVK